MATASRSVTVCTCDKCAHEWVPRIKRLPHFCPGCRSLLWNVSTDGTTHTTSHDTSVVSSVDTTHDTSVSVEKQPVAEKRERRNRFVERETKPIAPPIVTVAPPPAQKVVPTPAPKPDPKICEVCELEPKVPRMDDPTRLASRCYDCMYESAHAGQEDSFMTQKIFLGAYGPRDGYEFLDKEGNPQPEEYLQQFEKPQ